MLIIYVKDTQRVNCITPKKKKKMYELRKNILFGFSFPLT